MGKNMKKAYAFLRARDVLECWRKAVRGYALAAMVGSWLALMLGVHGMICVSVALVALSVLATLRIGELLCSRELARLGLSEYELEELALA